MEIVSAAADRTTIETQKRFRIFGPSSVLIPARLLEAFSSKHDPNAKNLNHPRRRISKRFRHFVRSRLIFE